MQKSQNPKTTEDKSRILNLVFKLVDTDWPHSHVITVKEAKKIGFSIDDSQSKLQTLKLYKEYVRMKLNEQKAEHIVNLFAPNLNEKNKKTSDKQQGV